MTAPRSSFTAILLVLFAGTFCSRAQANGDTTDIQSAVLNLYESGRISEAEHLALKALDERSDLTDIDRSGLYVLLAFCAIAEGDEDGGVRQFRSALRLNPDLAPDPITWSPKVRRVFDRAFKEQLATTAQGQQYSDAMRALTCKQAAAKSLIMPGAGQRAKHQPVKGNSLTALFWAATAAFAYAEVILPGTRNDYHNADSPAQASSKWRAYRDIYHLAAVSGTAAVALYVASFADALWTAPAPADTIASRK